MSAFRLSTSMRAATATRPLSTRVSVRSFQSSRRVAAGKETAEASEARKQEIDREKHAQLKDQKEGKNEWRDALASESESVLKADRGEIKADKSTIQELQKESAKAAQQGKK